MKVKNYIFPIIAAVIGLLTTGIFSLVFKQYSGIINLEWLQYLVPLLYVFILATISKVTIYKKSRTSVLENISFSWPVFLLIVLNIPLAIMPVATKFPPVEGLALRVIALLALNLMVGFFEETLFRGVIQGYFIDKIKANPKTAIFATSILFALFHLGNLTTNSGRPLAVILQVCYTFGIGLLFGCIYFVSKSIYLVAILHGLLDFSSDIVRCFDVPKPVGPQPDINLVSALITLATIIPFIIEAKIIFKKKIGNN